jgi:hypothetical protein
MMDAYTQTESFAQELKGASVEWPWFQKKNVRISILIPVPQVRDFIQPKYRVGRNLALYQARGAQQDSFFRVFPSEIRQMAGN